MDEKLLHFMIHLSAGARDGAIAPSLADES